MTQYLIEIKNDEGWLIRSYPISEEYPITPCAGGRSQTILTNTTSYEAIVETYRKYKRRAIFYHNPEAETINCLAPPEAVAAWNIN